MAWNASSAVCRSPRICWQTRKTIGPCRRTRAAKAISAELVAIGGESRQQLTVAQPLRPFSRPRTPGVESGQPQLCPFAMIVTSLKRLAYPLYYWEAEIRLFHIFRGP